MISQSSTRIPLAEFVTSSVQPQNTKSATVAMVLALLTLSVYIATTGMHFISHDEVANYVVARDLAGRASIDVDPIAWLNPTLMGQTPATLIGQGGHSYAIREMSASILAVPFVWLAHAIGVSPVRTTYLLSPLITAATVGLLFLMLEWLGYRRLSAVIGALAFGLATSALPYARTLYAQPCAALGLLVGTWGSIKAHRDNSWQAALWAGLGMGFAGLSVMPLWIVAPLYGLFLAPLGAWRTSLGKIISAARLKSYAAYLLGSGAFLLMQAWYNTARFGGPFETGQVALGIVELGLRYFPNGLSGQLISVQRGILWYVPLTLLAIPGIIITIRKRQHIDLLVILCLQALIVIFFYSIYRRWLGGVQFGNRYLMPLMPTFLLLSAPWFDFLLLDINMWFARIITGVILLLSLLTQFAGGLLNFIVGSRRIWIINSITPERARYIIDPAQFDVSLIPQVWAFRLLQKSQWDVVWMSRGSLDWEVLIPILVLTIVGVFLLLLAFRTHASKLSSQPVTMGYALLVLAVIGLILWKYPQSTGFNPFETPQSSGWQDVLSFLKQQAKVGDEIICLLYEKDSFAWFDAYDGAVHDTGLTIQKTLDGESAAQLERIKQTTGRVWLVSSGTPPGNPENAVEKWLAEHAYAGSAMDLGNYRVAMYLFATQDPPLKKIGLIAKDNKISLVAYGTEKVSSLQGSWINVRLQWITTQTVSTNYIVFVHLRDINGQVIAQQDGLPVSAFAPTETWIPNHLIIDRHALMIPADLPPGDYDIFIGLYDSDNGSRLMFADGQDDVLIDHITIKQ